MKNTSNIQSRVRLADFDAKLGLDRGASKFKEIIWYFIKITIFLSAFPYPSSLKVFLLRAFGAQVGTNITLKPRVNIHFPWKLEIGDHVWIGEESCLLNFEKLIIGDNVCISQRSYLCGGNHDYRKPSMPYRNGPITLNNGCWIGACSFIGPNVVIGTDAVITAGSTITSNIEPNIVCRKSNFDFEKPRWNQDILNQI
ncbi:WcaF family extracellular polysaccharide biosynthesis acetyltransferase [Zunongwangia sp. HRR-M8]|uniref:WcaF family extracellular polysaccharide biosynthesis acetyltransferase n=1 Tax=Zunongwangia sp. HRR-M8 TaxID=3015170 RepID=UPI0022DD87AB|nr:WcaF family extracellular polysaccharide biosynthesis acetyltransferase [Zunongwangia sp. HRR-M8]WBL21652.1 WcaF family extracellular polysaccharide biosynthesis acetyltransferase [Zunongwangia sp. HRR-M8]